MTSVSANGLSLVVGKRNPNDAAANQPQTMNSENGASIQMPKLSSVFKDTSKVASGFQTKMVASDSNPYQSSQSSVTGSIVSLDLTDNDGNPLAISNTTEPFLIRIKCKQPARAFRANVSQVGITYHKVRFLKFV